MNFSTCISIFQKPVTEKRSTSNAEDNSLNLQVQRSSTEQVIRSALSNVNTWLVISKYSTNAHVGLKHFFQLKLLELTKTVNVQSDYVLQQSTPSSSETTQNKGLLDTVIKSAIQMETIKLFSDLEEGIHQKIQTK